MSTTDLRALDVSQNAITGTRRMILTQGLDPTIVMQALVDELKYGNIYRLNNIP